MSKFDPDLLRHRGVDAGSRIDAALALAESLANDWDVELNGWLPGGTCSLVLTGERRGEATVLRVPLLELKRDASLDALRALAPHGGVPLIEFDEESGAVLMPRLDPGTSLAEVNEEDALDACAEAILRLRRAEGRAPDVATYFDDLSSRPKPSDLRVETDCAALLRRLLETSPAPRFMHGDLHHFNVLNHQGGWVAIDPEGIVGDPSYEMAAFIRNPVPDLGDAPDLGDLLRARVLRFSERLGDPPERIWGWALVRTALCVWTERDYPFRPTWLRVAQALDALRPEFAPTRLLPD